MRYIHSRFVGGLMLLLVVACAVTGWLLYPSLPAEFVSSWNAAGEPGGITTALWGVAGVPFTMLLLIGLWAVLPYLDPLKGLTKSRYVYDFVFFLIIALLSYSYALLLAANIDSMFDISTALVPALALFFFVIGVLMPRMKRNWYMGIRTPWTLSSERVWKKTHELGSTLFMGAGIVMLGGLFFPEFLTWILVAPVAVAAAVCVVYSYLAYREKEVH